MCLCGASIVRGCRPSRRGARVSPFNKATSPARIYSSHRDHSAIRRHATLVAPPPHRARAPHPAPSCFARPGCFAHPELLRPPRAASPAPSCFAVTPRRRTAPRAPPPPRRAHTAHCRAATRRPTAAPSSSPAICGAPGAQRGDGQRPRARGDSTCVKNFRNVDEDHQASAPDFRVAQIGIAHSSYHYYPYR